MTILVTGARGSVARAAIEQFLAAGETVRAASADPGSAEVPSGVDLVRLDWTDAATIGDALDGVDRVFLYASHEGIDDFIAAARKAGVERIVLLSSIAATFPSNPIGDRHLAVERPLRESGLPLTILRPGEFSTNALWWQKSVAEEGVVRLPYPDVHGNPIHEGDMAEIAVRALSEDGHDGKIYPLTGPESLSLRRRTELIGEAIGREVRVEVITHEQAAEFMFPIILEMQKDQGPDPVEVGPTIADHIGAEPRTFARWAADHAGDFTAA